VPIVLIKSKMWLRGSTSGSSAVGSGIVVW
jgi:hypothetical protein